MRDPRPCGAGLLAAGLLLTACASGGARTADAATTTLLRRDMTTLVAAAASKNYSAAGVALTVLNADAQAAARPAPRFFHRLNARKAVVIMTPSDVKATLSFSDGVRCEKGDVFEIESEAFGLPLRNKLTVAKAEKVKVVAL